MSGKISISFKSTTRKPLVATKIVLPAKDDRQLITHLEDNIIELNEPNSRQEAEPELNIPCSENTLQISKPLKIAKAVDASPRRDESNDTNTKYGTLDQQAVYELLKAAKEVEPEVDASANALVVTAAITDKDAANPSTLEDYEKIPIDKFGMAMLRGMGWKKDPAAKKTKFDDDILVRPKGMGLGADSCAKPRTLDIKPAENEKLDLKKNAFVRVLAGKHKDLYGEVMGMDDNAGRVIVKFALGGAQESLNEFMVQVVSQVEYKIRAKVINSARYDEYMNKESEEKKRVEGSNRKDLNLKHDADYKKRKDDSKKLRDKESIDVKNTSDAKKLKHSSRSHHSRHSRGSEESEKKSESSHRKKVLMHDEDYKKRGEVSKRPRNNTLVSVDSKHSSDNKKTKHSSRSHHSRHSRGSEESEIKAESSHRKEVLMHGGDYKKRDVVSKHSSDNKKIKHSSRSHHSRHSRGSEESEKKAENSHRKEVLTHGGDYKKRPRDNTLVSVDSKHSSDSKKMKHSSRSHHSTHSRGSEEPEKNYKAEISNRKENLGHEADYKKREEASKRPRDKKSTDAKHSSDKKTIKHSSRSHHSCGSEESEEKYKAEISNRKENLGHESDYKRGEKVSKRPRNKKSNREEILQHVGDYKKREADSRTPRIDSKHSLDDKKYKNSSEPTHPKQFSNSRRSSAVNIQFNKSDRGRKDSHFDGARASSHMKRWENSSRDNEHKRSKDTRSYRSRSLSHSRENHAKKSHTDSKYSKRSR